MIKCPECKSNNYKFRRSKRGVSWKCYACNFAHFNKNADLLLKENPLNGALGRDVKKIEEKFEKDQEKKDE